jgi:hypothetical protein
MPLLGKFAVAEVKKLCLLNHLVGVVTCLDSSLLITPFSATSTAI